MSKDATRKIATLQRRLASLSEQYNKAQHDITAYQKSFREMDRLLRKERTQALSLRSSIDKLAAKSQANRVEQEGKYEALQESTDRKIADLTAQLAAKQVAIDTATQAVVVATQAAADQIQIKAIPDKHSVVPDALPPDCEDKAVKILLGHWENLTVAAIDCWIIEDGERKALAQIFRSLVKIARQ